MFQPFPGTTPNSPSPRQPGALSPRLALVRSLVPPDTAHVDLATGHGLLLAQLAREQPGRPLLGTDRSPAEAEEARRRLKATGELRAPEVLVTDRLVLPAAQPSHPRRSASIAGLGGRTVARLLTRTPRTTQQLDRLIVQPNRFEEELRQALHAVSFAPVREYLVEDRGYAYLVLDCAPVSDDNPPLTEEEQIVGRWHSAPRESPLLDAYARWHRERLRIRLAGLEASGQDEATVRRRVAAFERLLRNLREHDSFDESRDVPAKR